MKTYISISVVFLLLLLSCKKKEVMDKIIFISDKDDANLPAYTEWGYNSFGAEYDGDYFLVSEKITPCRITYNNNQLQFLLHGTVRNGRDMKLLFVFPSAPVSNYADLGQLNDVEIDLSDNDCAVKIIQGNVETTLDVLEGKLHFKRVQLLSIDGLLDRAILSGIFELRFIQSGFPANISSGRFDVGITNSVFSVY